MAHLFTTYYEKHYKASWYSCSAITTLMIYLAAFIVPFLFVYWTNGLWVKQQIYWEQPDILFRSVLLLQVLDSDGVSS